MFITIISTVIVLSILVFFHELGHFWTARRFGMKPKEFGFGMPPRAFGFYKNDNGKWAKVIGKKDPTDAADTIYSINWLPLGGFVNLQEDEDGSDDPNHFSKKPIYQRAIILVAGVTMNVILAMALLSVGYMAGMPQSTDEVGEGAIVSDRKMKIVEIVEGSPAGRNGFAVGDAILSINGVKFEKFSDLQKYVDGKKGEKLSYEIERNGSVLKLEVVPELIEETNRGGIGVAISETGLVKYPFHLAIWYGIKSTLIMLWLILSAFFLMIKSLIFGQGLSGEVAGPVGIAVITGQVARMGIAYIMQFTAVLSLNLAIINALPIPALDGGRLLFLLIEKIKGRPVKRELEGTMHYIGFALLMLLVVVVTYRDLAKYGEAIIQKIF